MGDRANVFVVDPYAKDVEGGHSGVYLYTHWRGHELPGILADALDSPEGRGRWSDGSYLARIIFDKMTDLAGGETGFGISTSLCDNSYHILVVNPDTQRVGMVEEGQERSKTVRLQWSFEDWAESRPEW